MAVIGAGVAGLSTAYELVRAGRSVAVLEAGRVAAGVTGHTTAKLSVQHTLIYDKLRRTRDAEAARLYARSQTEAIEHAAALVDELGIDCDWETRDSYTYVRDAGRVDELRAEAAAAREAGLPASFVTETGLPFPVAGRCGSPGRRSSIRASTCWPWPRTWRRAAAGSSRTPRSTASTRASRAGWPRGPVRR